MNIPADYIRHIIHKSKFVYILLTQRWETSLWQWMRMWMRWERLSFIWPKQLISLVSSFLWYTLARNTSLCAKFKWICGVRVKCMKSSHETKSNLEYTLLYHYTNTWMQKVKKTKLFRVFPWNRHTPMWKENQEWNWWRWRTISFTASSTSAAWFYLIQPIRHIQSDKRLKSIAMFFSRLRWIHTCWFVNCMQLENRIDSTCVCVCASSFGFGCCRRYKRRSSSRFSLQFALNSEKGYTQFGIY